MPRTGQNPARWAMRGPSQPMVEGATVVHVPEPVGYWEGAIAVLEACLRSWHATTPGVPLHVVDNASHADVRSMLLRYHEQGIISRLTLSNTNLGKVGAWNLLFCASLADYVAYFDSDVFFLPGWLEESLRIARAFPEAGMITAQPIAGGDQREHWTSRAARKDPGIQVKEGCLVAEEYLRSHLAGLGADAEAYLLRQKDRVDVLLERGNTRAMATASHFQFLAPRGILRRLFPATPTALLGDDLQFDVEMEGFGAWRLSTMQYLVHHLGNRIGDLRAELPWAAPESIATCPPGPAILGKRHHRWLLWLAGREVLRRLLKRIASVTHAALAAGRE